MYENRNRTNPSSELIFFVRFVYIKTNNSKSFFFSLCKYERFSIFEPQKQSATVESTGVAQTYTQCIPSTKKEEI